MEWYIIYTIYFGMKFVDSCPIILVNSHANYLYGYSKEHTSICVELLKSLVGFTRNLSKSSSPPLLAFRKSSTLEFLKFKVGSSNLNILLKTEGAKEIGGFPCNWMTLCSVSNLSMHQRTNSLKSTTLVHTRLMQYQRSRLCSTSFLQVEELSTT
jgi:hypothetical protein